MASPTRVRIKKRRRRSLWERFGGIILSVAAIAACVGAYYLFLAIVGRRGPGIDGYIGSPAVLMREYQQFHGAPLKESAITQQFTQAAKLMQRRDFRGAALVLEGIADAAVPCVYTDLGLLYERSGDRARAILNFREALARDLNYPPLRAILARLSDFPVGSAEPLTHEEEPNSAPADANVIALEKDVTGTINFPGDDDYFRFTAPPAPRDLIEVRLQGRSSGLLPVLALYNSGRRSAGFGLVKGSEGERIVQRFSPAPNSLWYVQLGGENGTKGDYTLTVRALQAFDKLEPNDDFESATALAPGATLEANIMDEHDTDFYTFVSPRDGRMLVKLVNKSSTLVPSLSFYTAERRPAGGAAEERTPGASMKAILAVEDGKTYFIQVGSQLTTHGAYSITLDRE